MNEILAEEGLARDQLKIPGLRDWFFSRGERPALCLPESLVFEADNDEHNAGLKKLSLAFELPRGAYATLLVKRLAAVPSEPQA
jgi:tRNA pseudouridine13 synthase